MYIFRLQNIIAATGTMSTKTNIHILYDITDGDLSCHCTEHDVKAPN